MKQKFIFCSILFLFSCNIISFAQPTVNQFEVYELSFNGKSYTVSDDPVRDVELITTWRHKSGRPTYQVYGFYDGDGNGGVAGNVFKVRFCPTEPGQWNLVNVQSNDEVLDGQKEGFSISCTGSDHHGFWQVDNESRGNRWYKRTDGSHQYIIGNTLYSFVSEYYDGRPNDSDIVSDVRRSSEYFNKIRFAITGDIYPNPEEKPFVDTEGNPTDEGNYSFRPNPKWFSERVDQAVQEMYDQDVIADIILNGPDSYNARSALLAKYNGGDPTPFLKYMAARYGSYPNVWFCLSNEYNIRNPQFTEREMKVMGHMMKPFITYGNPLSVHPNQQDWDPELNSINSWNDHIIIQNKIKNLGLAADKIELNYWKGNRKPVINDELAYQGEGDDWSEEDVIEAFVGTFLGGGYGTSGYKSGSKLGHYFAGNFSAEEHSAADNLKWMNDQINENIEFWQMEPFTIFFYRPNGTNLNIFHNVSYDCRLLMNGGEEYVLGVNQEMENVEARLPEGNWRAVLYDVISKSAKNLGDTIEGRFTFNVPDSRAVFVHFKRN